MGKTSAASVASLTFAASVIACSTVSAQDYSKEDIIRYIAASLETAETKGLTHYADDAPNYQPFNLMVTFELNSSALTSQARANIDEFAEALQDLRLSKVHMFVDGHTDRTGSAEYNQELSERRANAVVGYLVQRGVPLDRLTARGFGETRPVDADGYDEANRRVETSVSHMNE
ncbi:MAG: OmpA family protein [Thermomicrobiales bacterium]|nr:OmpA family protein [Thermomicrobiales bacterium]